MLGDILAVVSRPLDGFRAPLITGVLALAVSYLLTPVVRDIAIKRGAVDDPKADDRRVHTVPTPRWGGLAIYAGIVASLLVVLPFAYPRTQAYPPYLIGMLVIAGALVVIGALDDLYQYKAKVQAILLLLAGVAVQLFVSPMGRVQIGTVGIPLSSPSAFLPLGIAAIPLTAIYIFVVTKTMDTIDGVDGLAAGIATIAAATLSIIATYTVLNASPAHAAVMGAAYHELPRIALVAAAVGGSAIGFLRHNYNPARIFMGTGGAYVLGFMLACLSIVGALKTAAAVAVIIPMLVFGVPIFDAFFVISRRILSGQPITQADKRHLHHTLLKKGLSVRQTMWVMCLMAAALCVVAFIVIKALA